MSTNIRGNKTRSEILDAAWDLISSQGADVSVSEIASTVGISRQTVYLHFGTRGGLLMALVRRADERFGIKEQFDAALEKSDPRERLRDTLRAWLNFVPKVYPVAKDLIRLRDTDTEAAAAWEDRMSDLRDWLLALTHSLYEDGALKGHWTPQQASRVFWAQTSIQVWGLLKSDCGWPDEEIAKCIEQAMLDCLLRD